MGDNFMKSQEHFSLHLDGGSVIDAELLSSTIGEMVNITKAAAADVAPDAYIKLNVTAFKNGSFEVDFSTICEVAEKISPIAATASAIVGVIGGYFKIKNHLGGKHPKQTEKVDNNNTCFINEDGKQLIVNSLSGNIIQNSAIDRSVTNIISYIGSHNGTGSFSFDTPTEKTYYDPEAVQRMSKQFDIKNDERCKTYTGIVDLEIVRPAFKGNSAWTFIYDDHQITAQIKDDRFLDEIHSGKVSIKAGSYIKANLERSVITNELGMPINNSEKFVVLEVFGSIQNNDDNQLTI